MEYEKLDATLKGGRIISDWLAGWLIEAAETPENATAVVTEGSSDGRVIELRDSRGVAVGGIVFVNARGAVHVLAALDPKNEPLTKKRSWQEMLAAQHLAIAREKFRDRCVEVYEFCVYGLLPLLALALVWFLAHKLL